MLGPPHFPENPVPTWEEFVADYQEWFFDGAPTDRGRCFIILDNGVEVGQVNYNDVIDDSTELDIWLAGNQFAGKGCGTAALVQLCEMLWKDRNCRTFFIAPSARNRRAVASYLKAGFVETDVRPHWFVPDYRDAVVMRKTSVGTLPDAPG